MRVHRSLKIAATVLLGCAIAAAEKNEYFTEGEIDLIRDAQELPKRVEVCLRLADIRLVELGLKERPAKEKEKDRKDPPKGSKAVKILGPMIGIKLPPPQQVPPQDQPKPLPDPSV